MFYFLLSISASTAIFLVFKLFPRFGLQTYQAIVFNYWTAFLFGTTLLPRSGFSGWQDYEWIWLAPIEGLLFISIFTVMALTVQKHSVTVGSVASRTAMIIPAAVFMFMDPQEGFSVLKVIGILLALGAVVLSSKRNEKVTLDQRYVYLPIILFVGSGLVDLIIGYAQGYLMQTPEEAMVFIPSIFLVAAVIGTSFLIYRYRVKKDIQWQWKDVIGGLVLGLVNYASIFFIIKAMDTGLLHTSLFFPVHNMGVILAGTMMGLFAFRERLSVVNWVGIIIGLLAIGMIIFPN
ncbi:MAG: hypothetical protein HKN79_08110 [Flavobacteriales bacterium]|nr:hypothetical protein [Flavobacteriales bacterium]